MTTGPENMAKRLGHLLFQLMQITVILVLYVQSNIFMVNYYPKIGSTHTGPGYAGFVLRMRKATRGGYQHQTGKRYPTALHNRIYASRNQHDRLMH